MHHVRHNSMFSSDLAKVMEEGQQAIQMDVLREYHVGCVIRSLSWRWALALFSCVDTSLTSSLVLRSINDQLEH